MSTLHCDELYNNNYIQTLVKVFTFDDEDDDVNLQPATMKTKITSTFILIFCFLHTHRKK